jgi:hypothetical protein
MNISCNTPFSTSATRVSRGVTLISISSLMITPLLARVVDSRYYPVTVRAAAC